MPSVGDVTITVTWSSGATDTYTVAAGDVSGITKTDAKVSFHGKKGNEATADDFEITRSATREIRYHTN